MKKIGRSMLATKVALSVVGRKERVIEAFVLEDHLSAQPYQFVVLKPEEESPTNLMGHTPFSHKAQKNRRAMKK